MNVQFTNFTLTHIVKSVVVFVNRIIIFINFTRQAYALWLNNFFVKSTLSWSTFCVINWNILTFLIPNGKMYKNNFRNRYYYKHQLVGMFQHRYRWTACSTYFKFLIPKYNLINNKNYGNCCNNQSFSINQKLKSRNITT